MLSNSAVFGRLLWALQQLWGHLRCTYSLCTCWRPTIALPTCMTIATRFSVSYSAGPDLKAFPDQAYSLKQFLLPDLCLLKMLLLLVVWSSARSHIHEGGGSSFQFKKNWKLKAFQCWILESLRCLISKANMVLQWVAIGVCCCGSWLLCLLWHSQWWANKKLFVFCCCLLVAAKARGVCA